MNLIKLREHLMRQLTQTLKNGKLHILDVPVVPAGRGTVKVRNHYSMISTGTEGTRIRQARSSYLAKARSRPGDVRQVLETVRTHGVSTTCSLVNAKLSVPAPLGYSCAGEIVECGPGVRGLRPGDLVACGGETANHAELVCVPANLCARIDGDVDLKHASMTTIAAIALQGIRQADLRLGENCAVIGLGLLGQLTLQLLNAAGIRAMCIDIDPRKVGKAHETGATLALERNHPVLEQVVMQHTHGHGADAVIITAGSASRDPIELAGRLCRKKGKIVVVGAVPTGFSRDHFYKKELDLRMSCSYGPGRYDPSYERRGLDYPYPYVRWTEGRNMSAYLQLLADGRINVEPLISHTFDFESAKAAYDLILEDSGFHLGIVLKYDVSREIDSHVVRPRVWSSDAGAKVGFIGAGSFAQNILLPAAKKAGTGQWIGVSDIKPHVVRYVMDRYGIGYGTGNEGEILENNEINTVLIATPHHLHAEQVLRALRARKNVFVEKPLCMTEKELQQIQDEYRRAGVHLMVGFNRRFAPLVRTLKSELGDTAPLSIHYRINAAPLPPDHWVHDREIGGGRILGEVCHFIDLCLFLAGSPIDSLSASTLADPLELQDTLVINLRFRNGSIASIGYFSNGAKRAGKERLELFCNGRVAVLDDYRRLELYQGNRKRIVRSDRDKGHAGEIGRFLGAVDRGEATPVSIDDIVNTTRATFKVLDSIRDNRVVFLQRE